ncbi:hypothetical protein V6N13_075714 [Hibiscus sabdariffa]
MGSYSFFFFFFSIIAFLDFNPFSVSGASFSEFIYPNFTASHFSFINNDGAFLFSRNGTFKASIYNPEAEETSFYLCIIHVESNTIIWSANRDSPISSSGEMNLTVQGISVTGSDGDLKWSTPQLQASVRALTLTDTGNLVLLDHSNGSLWESFHCPMDTIVFGQRLSVGANLSSTVSGSNLSTGDYRFLVTGSDAILQWHQQTYWRLSMDTKAYMNSNYVVEYMEINQTGLDLLGRNGSVVVIRVNLSTASFRIAKLDASGQFSVSSFSSGRWVQEFVGPIDGCQIPTSCGKMGLCTTDSTSNAPACSCPSGFHSASQNIAGCLPNNSSYSLPTACDSTNNVTVTKTNSSDISYMKLGPGMEYFSLIFSQPEIYGVNYSACQDLCSGNCSCLGMFYDSSSGSCYVLENELGTIILSDTVADDLQGYVKVLVGPTSTDFNGGNGDSNGSKNFPTAAIVLLPFTGVFLLAALVFLWLKSWKVNKSEEVKLHHRNSFSSDDLDGFSIPGLPQKFNYEELELATDSFKTQIGAGGFGAVYKGTLPDKTVVAVKKITNPGNQGKKEFCTEIAVIGNIHHVNLVKLRGFCAHGRQRFLVYEYMNRGSLDRSLFGNGPALEWQESGRKNCSLRSNSHTTNETNSGRANNSSSSSVIGLVYFPLFALEMHEQGRYLELADPRLEGRVNNKEVEKLVRIALCCVHEEPALRPSMTIVVGMLEGGLPLIQPRVESLNFLRFYGRRFTEASMVDEENRQSDDNFMLFRQENGTRSSIVTTGSNTCFSYMSSQQISGPR